VPDIVAGWMLRSGELLDHFASGGLVDLGLLRVEVGRLVEATEED